MFPLLENMVATTMTRTLMLKAAALVEFRKKCNVVGDEKGDGDGDGAVVIEVIVVTVKVIQVKGIVKGLGDVRNEDDVLVLVLKNSLTLSCLP